MCVPVPSVVSPAPLRFSVRETRQQKHNTIQWLHMLHHTCRRLLRILYSCDAFRLGLPRGILSVREAATTKSSSMSAGYLLINAEELTMTSGQSPGFGGLVAGRAAALAAAPALVGLLGGLGAPAPQVLVRADPEALRHGPAPEPAARALQPLLLELLALPCSYTSVLISAHPELLRQGPAQDATCALQPLLPELIALPC